MKAIVRLVGAIFLFGLSTAATTAAAWQSPSPAQSTQTPIPAPVRLEPSSQALAQAITEAQPAARTSLGDMRRAGVPGRYRLLGFKSPDEAKSGVLGQPMAVFYVPLNQLQNYAGGDPQALLQGGNEILYPVTIGTEVRSSITVRNLNGKWQTTQLGRPILARTLFGIRDNDAAKLNSPTSSYFVVLVSALNLRFIGHLQGTQFFLIPTRSDPTLNLRAGVAYLAQGVFSELVPVAKANNGQPT
ncbi:MAG TPA: hypothetical protein VME18_12410 [Acidobacteriaceae bacterium]|nr:hypothetical protein [Acidobacteriaceae bacterium]